MKVIWPLFTALAIFCFAGHAQTVKPATKSNKSTNYAITYLLRHKFDTLVDYHSSELFSLRTNGQKSVFSSLNYNRRDSVLNSYSAVPFTQLTVTASQAALSSIPKPTFKYTVYKIYATHQIFYTDEIEPRKLYTYQEPADLIAWQIKPAVISFKGYKCQEATTLFRGRKYTALFTREIPIPDGPYKFSGLPGLVVKVADSRNDYTFELAGLREVKDMTEPVAPAKARPTNRAEYNKAYQDFQLSFIDRAAEFGVTLSDPVAAKANWREKVRHRNNPLEKLDR